MPATTRLPTIVDVRGSVVDRRIVHQLECTRLCEVLLYIVLLRQATLRPVEIGWLVDLLQGMNAGTDATTQHQVVLVLLSVVHALSPAVKAVDEPAANEDLLGRTTACIVVNVDRPLLCLRVW